DGVNLADFALLSRNWLEAGVPLVINEVMASNTSSTRDPQGQYDDWIEIHNSGTAPINMGNMYLTDDPDIPTKWRVPGNNRLATTVPAGGYLLIWADNDTSDFGLHANFKLDADGEEVSLFDTDGVTLIDSISFPEQTSDMSYGRYPDANEIARFLAVPTPGAENNGAYLGEVKTPQFSHKRGFYRAPFLVTLATETDGATIHYTLDGARPYEQVGRFPTGAVYTGPILVNKTTCLRAKAVKPGWKPSAIKTQTFVLNASEAVKSLPLISLVGDARTTFYEPDGVMAIVGGSYGADGRWVASGPESHNNPMQRGMEYERPVSFEFIEPDSSAGFQVDCGLRVHGSDYMRPRYTRGGGYWSGNSKFSFRLYFRDRYGPSRLEYPLFPFEVERFKSIVLRGGHNDRVNPFIKDELIRRLHKDMGHVDSGGTMANLFINGEYKGYFNPCEHVKDASCQQWYNSDNDWDVMTMSGVRDGDAIAWNEMLNYARGHNLSDDVHYTEVARLLDIPAFIDYLILQLWCANWDWPQNNWSAARERSDEGKWRFFIWDAEGGMYSDRMNLVRFAEMNSQGNPITYLYQALKVSSTFRQVFGDRLYKHFYNSGALTADNITQRFLELRDQMSGVIPSMDTYVISTWVPNRHDIFLQACLQEGLFTSDGPTFEVNGLPQHGGHLSDDDILTIASYGRFKLVYYTLDGSDPHPPGISTDPATTTLVAEGATKRAFVPLGDIDDTWKGSGAFDDSTWLYSSGSPGGVGFERERAQSYQNLISLNVELQMYTNNVTCYIRIPFVPNISPGDLDFMTLKIRYDDGFIAYLNGAEIARRNFSGTPAWNSNADSSRPDSEAAQLEIIDVTAALSALQRGGNVLAIQGMNSSAADPDFLISAELEARGSVSGTGLPSVMQYTGPITLSHSANVKARVLTTSTWSALSEAVFAVGPVAENLRITEIMYHPKARGNADEPNEEFIELKNIGAESINLNLVSFTNGIDFTFPDVELAPGEYVLAVQDRTAFEGRYGSNLNIAGQYSGSLNNGGERIRLEDAVGQTILDFNYKDGWRSATDGEGFSLTIIDPMNPDLNSWDEKDSWRASAYAAGSPGQDDSGIIPNPSDVVINEVLAHAHAEASDWIELHNTTDKTIDIGGWFLSDSKDNFFKYQIAGGTTIDPYGYIVFYEDLHF
ncbi:MAG: lamin tail domain-containing protein, partial [Planctomycetota bacterium]